MKGNIFISYRSDESAGYARALYDRLCMYFGKEQLFFDVESKTIVPGSDLPEVIKNAIGFCKMFILLIGKNWLLAEDESKRRKLDDPKDYVRLEILTACDSGIQIIPVLIDGAKIPRHDELPDTLSFLAEKKALKISNEDFNSDIDRLIMTLTPIFRGRTFYIIAKHSGKCLAIDQIRYDNNAYVVQYECLNYDNHKFRLEDAGEDAGDHYWYIIAKHSEKGLSIEKAALDDYAKVVQYDCLNYDNHKFKLVAAGDGYWNIINKHSKRCLAIEQMSPYDGAKVVQYMCPGGDNHKFKLKLLE